MDILQSTGSLAGTALGGPIGGFVGGQLVGGLESLANNKEEKKKQAMNKLIQRNNEITGSNTLIDSSNINPLPSSQQNIDPKVLSSLVTLFGGMA